MPLRVALLLVLLAGPAAQGGASRRLLDGGGTGGPQSSPPSDGNLSGVLQGCTDIAPSGGKTCAELKAAGACNSPVTTSRNYCAATCVRCIPSTPTPAPATDPEQPPSGARAPEPSSLSSSQPSPEPSLTAESPAPAAEPSAPAFPAAHAVEASASTAAAALTAAPSLEPQASSAPAVEVVFPAAPSALAPALEFEGVASDLAPAAESSSNSLEAAAAAAANASALPAASAANASAIAVPGSDKVFHGDGTAYSEAVKNTGKGFACSYRYLNDWASMHFAAVNLPQWDNGMSCGKCATVRCIDERCKVQDKDVTVMIVDQCPECKHGDLDFSIPVYREITGMWPHRLRVQWQWADCSPFINGTIRMYPKDGVNAYWQAFFFANMKYPLASVALNGQVLTRSQYGFYQHPGSLGDGPHKLDFEAENGMRVTAFSDDPLKEQDLGVQF